MDREERAALVERYAAGHAEVVAALAGITPAELDAVPSDRSWTARRVVHHLADSEMTSAIRLRRLLTEDRPQIPGYDEAAWAELLRYDRRAIEPALDALGAARATTVQLLTLLQDDEWARAGTHAEHGRYGVEDWLRIYAEHAHEHADQIRRARAAAARGAEAGG